MGEEALAVEAMGEGKRLLGKRVQMWASCVGLIYYALFLTGTIIDLSNHELMFRQLLRSQSALDGSFVMNLYLAHPVLACSICDSLLIIRTPFVENNAAILLCR